MPSYSRLSLVFALALAPLGCAFTVSPLVARSGVARVTALSMAGPGADIKTVDETCQRFDSQYRKPLSPKWRSIVKEVLNAMHFATIDSRYTYDCLNGYGVVALYETFLTDVPGGEATREKLLDATAYALELDAGTMRADHAAVKEWAVGKTEDDIVAAAGGGGEGPVADALAAVKAASSHVDNRASNYALLQLMAAAGVPADEVAAKRWAGALGVSEQKLVQDAALMKAAAAQIAGMQQMTKAMEIRAKKQIAENLEKKAREAQAQAEKAIAAAGKAAAASGGAAAAPAAEPAAVEESA